VNLYKNIIYLFDQSCIFSIITPVFSVTWSSEIKIIYSRNISDYYQCWKQSCCSIFLWKPWYFLFFRIHRWIDSSEEQRLFETEVFCNIINVFTATFDQFNASLLNKNVVFFLHLVGQTRVSDHVSSSSKTLSQNETQTFEELKWHKDIKKEF